MIKRTYLAMLKFGTTRRILRGCRSKVLRACGRSDAYDEVTALSQKSEADLFLDIGCHQGEILQRFIESGLGCKVTAFDPISSNLDKARDKLSQYTQVAFVEAAVSDNDGKATFFVNRNEQTSSLLENDQGNSRSFPDDTLRLTETEVETLRLDTWMKSSNHRADRIFIKCDTQGNEARVIRGGMETFRTKVVGFYAEVMLDDMYEGQATITELRDLLEKDCGLVLSNIYNCLRDTNGRALQVDMLWIRDSKK